jgi:hypothetical protein
VRVDITGQEAFVPARDDVAPDSPSSTSLFTATRRIDVLDHFGVPYRVRSGNPSRSLERLKPLSGGRAVTWPSESALRGPRRSASLVGRDGSETTLFARMVEDRAVPALLAETGQEWERAMALRSGKGQKPVSVWSAADGTVFLPFDPDEVRLNCLSERYREVTGPPGLDWRRLASIGYYRSRRLLPRSAQIWLRRIYARLQARAAFPRWPIETSLHDFQEWFFSIVQDIAEEPVPRIAAWPNGASWALVLTHDVETGLGMEALDPVLELERGLGLRSSWNFVPRRGYYVSPERVKALTEDGFEVGVHGLYHDGRDLESRSVLAKRLPAMREAAATWNAVGFRAPATQRAWELMPTLGFDYDSSYPDTDPFEPRGGGSCTWHPFFIGNVIELPMTMPQDHTLFVILRQPDGQAWIDKAEFLRSRGGMVLVDTHPDYLLDERIMGAYRDLLERYADDEDAWGALPADVARWWRRRAKSQLTRTSTGWTVTGPAADEARVEFVSGDTTWLDAIGGPGSSTNSAREMNQPHSDPVSPLGTDGATRKV